MRAGSKRSGILDLGKAVFRDFADDDAMSLAAAVAYYTALSMAPLVVLALWAAGLLGASAQDHVVGEIRALLGAEGGEAVELIVKNADERPSLGTLAGVFGILTLAFGATAVFAQLQTSMNRIWEVKAKPTKGVGGIFSWVRKRVLCFGMVLTVLFLLLVSTILSAAITVVAERTSGLPGGAAFWQTVYSLVSIAASAAVFALMFRFLPDAEVRWREVWLGGVVTAVLFALGRIGVSLYLGGSSIGSAYGAAGSLIVLLIWAYYSSLIFFLGAEFTQVHARARGRKIVPDPHAVAMRD